MTISDTIDTYLSGWNEADPARRASIIESVWAADGRLIDPPLAATGQEEISNMAAALQSQFPDHRFVRTSPVRRSPQPFPLCLGSRGSDGSVAIEWC